jgi:hypothetical protein
MELWSSVYLDGGVDWATAALEVGPWRRITCEYGEAGRLFAEIKLGGEEAAPFYMAIGTPVQPPGGASASAIFQEGMTQGAAERLYLPPWALQMLGLTGTGEFVSVDWFSQDVFPPATKVVLRPHDSAFYHADAKAELEVALTRLGVVQRGMTVGIPLDCLGGFEVLFDVIATEPANIVLAEGDEVAIEFEEALDAAAASPPLPQPEPEPATLCEDDAMLPPAIGPPAPLFSGHSLGGPSERRMPDGSRWNPWKHGPWTGPP